MPKTAWIWFAFLLPAIAYSGEMEPVPEAEAYCKTFDSYCYEWKFNSDPSLRFIAHGDEDGGVWLFYRRSMEGKYTKLFAVYPAMIDERRKGSIFWGYAWDIEDIVLAPGRGLSFLAAFNHGFTYDAEWIPPPGQKEVPFVLFKGTATQPDIKVQKKIRLKRMSVQQIFKRSRSNSSLHTDATRR